MGGAILKIESLMDPSHSLVTRSAVLIAGRFGDGVAVLQVIDLGDIDHTEGRNAFLDVKADEAVGPHVSAKVTFRREPITGIELAI